MLLSYRDNIAVRARSKKPSRIEHRASRDSAQGVEAIKQAHHQVKGPMRLGRSRMRPEKRGDGNHPENDRVKEHSEALLRPGQGEIVAEDAMRLQAHHLRLGGGKNHRIQEH